MKDSICFAHTPLAALSPLAVLSSLAALSLLMVVAGTAHAQEADTSDSAYGEIPAFDREWSLATYATAQVGTYRAGGIGGRIRWAPFDSGVPLEFEVYLEATLVDWAGEGFRHDYPNGLNLVLPIRLGGDFRLRSYAGFCDVLSFVEPAQSGAPRADDVLIGVHGGLGAEWALHPMFSVFVDAQANVYMGHNRASAGWTGGVSEDFTPFWNAQLNLGVQLHLGR